MTDRTRKLILCFLVLVVAVAAIILILDNNKLSTPARLKEPVATTVSFKVNTENLLSLISGGQEPDETMQKKVEAIVAIANELSIRTTSEGTSSRTQLLLKGEPLTSVSFRTGSDGITVAADLLKDTLLRYVPEENLDLSSFSFTEEEREKLEQVPKKHLADLESSLKDKLGEEEKGEWIFEEKTFTVRRPVNMTTKEALSLFYTFVRDFLADEEAASLTRILGSSYSPDDLLKSMEMIEQTPEDQLPSFMAWTYTAGRDSYTEIVTKDPYGAELSGGFGTVGAFTVMRLNVPDTADVYLKANTDCTGYELSAAFTSGETKIDIAASGVTQRTGESTGTVLLTVDGKEMLTVAYSLTSGEAVSGDFDEEGRTVVTLVDEDVSRFGQTENTSGLSGRLTSGLISLMQEASRIMPDEVNQLMTLLIQEGL